MHRTRPSRLGFIPDIIGAGPVIQDVRPHSSMSMFTRFGQIFWGLLFAILDLNINGFDLLPDFVGYFLIAAGCSGLASESKHFSTAQTWSLTLAILALVSFVIPNDLDTLFGFLRLAVDCAMMWFLLGGVMEFTTARERLDLSERASHRRVAYVVLMCMASLAGVVVRGSRDAGTVMIMLTMICVLPLLILILHLIHRVKHELAG
jgi:hypothetical protein